MRARVTDRYCVILLLFVASHVTGFSTSRILTYDRLQTHTRKRTPWEHDSLGTSHRTVSA